MLRPDGSWLWERTYGDTSPNAAGHDDSYVEFHYTDGERRRVGSTPMLGIGEGSEAKFAGLRVSPPKRPGAEISEVHIVIDGQTQRLVWSELPDLRSAHKP